MNLLSVTFGPEVTYPVSVAYETLDVLDTEIEPWLRANGHENIRSGHGWTRDGKHCSTYYFASPGDASWFLIRFRGRVGSF